MERRRETLLEPREFTGNDFLIGRLQMFEHLYVQHNVFENMELSKLQFAIAADNVKIELRKLKKLFLILLQLNLELVLGGWLHDMV
ncbi:hypothetical protein MTP99_019792 [Tenebrio molitor]|nr:hypothetical protein MTP99_019792 [Tenebrio molitor]